MTIDKFDFTSIISGMSPEERKEFLDDLQSNKLTDEAKRKSLDALQPVKIQVNINLLKENPFIFENIGSITANALAKDCIRRGNKGIR